MTDECRHVFPDGGGQCERCGERLSTSAINVYKTDEKWESRDPINAKEILEKELARRTRHNRHWQTNVQSLTDEAEGYISKIKENQVMIEDIEKTLEALK